MIAKQYKYAHNFKFPSVRLSRGDYEYVKRYAEANRVSMIAALHHMIVNHLHYLRVPST